MLPLRSRAPSATYRLQLTSSFTFRDVEARLGYFQTLGVSHLHLSPIFEAVPGSTHGYDVTDPTRARAECGGDQGFVSLATAARAHGLGLVVDFVPNHMSASAEHNAWWRDVLRHGRDSEYRRYFDVDWRGDDRRDERILLPVLPERYGAMLTNRAIRLSQSSGEWVMATPAGTFPLSPGSCADLDRQSAADLERTLEDPTRLHELLERQHYRLAWWRAGIQDLGYRRFFDVAELIGLRMEDRVVFDAVHRKLFEWIADGLIDGIRLDHIDGLADPTGYLKRLAAAAPDAWIVAEKILGRDETMRPDWPIAGTTGYDFLNTVSTLFLPGDASSDRREVAYASKKEVLRTLFGSEVARLATLIDTIAERRWYFRDYSREDRERVIEDVVASSAVYRTYAAPGTGPLDDADAAVIDAAVAASAARFDESFGPLHDLIRKLFRDDFGGDEEREFVWRCQQLMSASAAKGVEDTALYRQLDLPALNEVGAALVARAIGPAEFHARMRAAAAAWPSTMLALETHDTKWSADARARLLALAARNGGGVATHSALRRCWHSATERNMRDPLVERLFSLAAIAAWPLDDARAQAHMTKACREAKIRTSWIQPDLMYERSVASFVSAAMNDAAFRHDIAAFVSRLDRDARALALAAVALQLTCPGVPDIYQGGELWSHQLVDPDNRRPVDFGVRAAALASLMERSRPPDWRDDESGESKMWLIATLLRLRRDGVLRSDAPYEPLPIEGNGQAIAFSRGDDVIVFVPEWPRRKRLWCAIALPPGRWRSVLTGEIITHRLTSAAATRVLPCAVLRREQ